MSFNNDVRSDFESRTDSTVVTTNSIVVTHTNGRRPKDVRTVERETRDELQVTDHRSSGGSNHEEDWHACSMIGKAHPIEEQHPKL
jgi:hypothetical protein